MGRGSQNRKAVTPIAGGRRTGVVELILQLGLLALEVLAAGAWEAWAPKTKSPAPATNAGGPRVFDNKSWSVEEGVMRRWSRRRERRGDVLHMLEFRSHPSRILSFREGVVPGDIAARMRELQRRFEGRLFIESDGVTLVVRLCGSEPITQEETFRKGCQGLLRDLRSAAVPGRLVKGAGACPVCKEPASPERSCRSCGTPHHRECWSYAGRCGVFGCRERELR